MENLPTHPKESFYALLLLISSIIITIIVIFHPTGIPYYIFFMISNLFTRGILLGNLKANSIEITSDQLPEIHQMVQELSQKLNISVPVTYLNSNGGIINAFTSKYLRRNFIVVFADVIDVSLKTNPEIARFIIAHELAHIKLKHIFWSDILIASRIIPTLGLAYSRACEYSCDMIAAKIVPEGTMPGLMAVASGKNLFTKISPQSFVKQNTQLGFWSWFSEKFSAHPHLVKRLTYISKH